MLLFRKFWTELVCELLTKIVVVIFVVSLSHSHKLDREAEPRHDQTLRENMENMSAPPSYEKSQAAYPGDGG